MAELIAWKMTAKTRSTILAALDEATDAKRDKISVCPDCHDGTCGSCDFRRETAAEYDAVAAIVQETYDLQLEDSGDWRDGYEAGCRDEAVSCVACPRPEETTDREPPNGDARGRGPSESCEVQVAEELVTSAEPEPDDSRDCDPRPECDDDGGMSEYRSAWPEPEAGS